MKKIYYGCHNTSGGTWLVNTFLCLGIKNITPSFYTWTKREYSEAYTVKLHDTFHCSYMPIFKSKKIFYFDSSIELHGIGHYPKTSILNEECKTVYISRDLRDSYYIAFNLHYEILKFFEIDYKKFPEPFDMGYEHTIFPESLIDTWLTKQQLWENAEKKYTIFRPRFEDCKHSWHGVQQILDFWEISRSPEEIQSAIENSNSLGKDRGNFCKWKKLPPEMLAYITQRTKPYLEKRGYITECIEDNLFEDNYKDAHKYLLAMSAKDTEDIYIPETQFIECIPKEKIQLIIKYTYDMYVLCVAYILFCLFMHGNILRATSCAKYTLQLFLNTLLRITKDFPDHTELQNIFIKVSIFEQLLHSPQTHFDDIMLNILKKDPQLVHDLNLERVPLAGKKT